MRTLNIDIETFSSYDLAKTGVYRYVQAPDFEILLFAYKLDDGLVVVIDLVSGEELPEKIVQMLCDPSVEKTAHNANFERTCIAQHFHIILPPEQWSCTMAKASMLGLPIALDAASKALKLTSQKDAAGKALIKYFSIPCKPTKVNGGRSRNLPHHAPDKWSQFVEYCRQDVVVEGDIRHRIDFFQVPDQERRLWCLDQRINDTGVLLDPQLVQNAIRMDLTYREALEKEAVEITGLANPNSAQQLKTWLASEIGRDEITSLTKDAVTGLLDAIKDSAEDMTGTQRVLTIRQEMSKTSVKKYLAMSKAQCADNRVRGLLQYYGANRTGRWAGRLVQVQNLPRIEDSFDLDRARELTREGDLQLLELIFGNVPDVLSQLIRTAFIAPESHRLIVADFSAIEARVIAWLSGERWRLDVFNTHGRIYEASAAQMFKVPIEAVTKGSTLRNKGKMAELALGYQGGPNAIINIEIGNKTPERDRIPEEELPRLVAMWRNANQKIVRYWNTVGDAALQCVETGQPVMINQGIRFFKEKGILFIQLPSGRRLSYLRPQIRPNRYGNDAIVYEGMNQTTKQWGRQETYGGKLVENIVQAVARDLLADALLRVEGAGYKIVMHVHDEIVCEVPNEWGSCEEIDHLMGTPPAWAKGLPLKAVSYETPYYKKD